MPKKKLGYCQIWDICVMNDKLRVGERLRSIPINTQREKFDNAPKGTFIILPDSLILPKKSPGDKFVVTYTTVHQKEF